MVKHIPENQLGQVYYSKLQYNDSQFKMSTKVDSIQQFKMMSGLNKGERTQVQNGRRSDFIDWLQLFSVNDKQMAMKCYETNRTHRHKTQRTKSAPEGESYTEVLAMKSK